MCIDCDYILRPDSLLNQFVSELVTAVFQLAVGPRFIRVDNGDSIGGAFGPGCNIRVNGPFPGVIQRFFRVR